MQVERRRILEGVKEGSIPPEEALRLLEELDGDEPETAAGRTEPTEGSRPDLRLIRVTQEVGTVTVRGDPSVAQFRVSGPHSVREDGRTVSIKGDVSFAGVGFVMGPGERRARWHWPGKDKGQYSFLQVDVNPSIPLEVRVDAGKLHVIGVMAPIKAHVELGSLIVEDVEGAVDLSLESGTLRASGLLTGRSSLSCELGRVIAQLDPGSDIRVSAHCTLGSVSLDSKNGSKGRRSGVGSTGELMVGKGTGELDIRVEAGSIKVGVAR